MRDVVFWAALTMCVVSFVHSAILYAASRYHGKLSHLVFEDMPEYERLKANPPWTARYGFWWRDVTTRRRR